VKTKVTNLLNYIDSMMIIDSKFNILYSNRFNIGFNVGESFRNEYSDYINKTFFEVYPNIDLTESSMVEAIKNGKVSVRINESFNDMNGRRYTTNSITIPIIRLGKIVGAIELAQDITAVGDLESNGNASRGKSINICKTEKAKEFSFDDIITKNPEMLEAKRLAKIFALSNNHTLIYGETGTGKEMFVKAMVTQNLLRKKNFVTQNCASIPESIFESLLFGTTKGSFTGSENKIGLFEMAEGGILFLDELNAMPIYLQAKLLRVLQDGKVRAVGGRTEKAVNVKVIAATNKNPITLIKENLLREDLFYRLSSEILYLTALCERKEDIPLYIDHFVNEFNVKYSKNIDKMSPNLKKFLAKHDWPGNVRELRHVIESMINISKGSVLTIRNLPIYLSDGLDIKKNAIGDSEIKHDTVIKKASLKETLENFEREQIINALEACSGVVSHAAEILGMPRQTLKFRVDKLKIESDRYTLG
jgi:arginine utilization regulatory protein